jgi:hypothetical protein
MTAVEEPELQLLITSENEDAAMAENDYAPARLRVELALSAFLSAISVVKTIEETEARTSEYQDRVVTTLDEPKRRTSC